MRNAAASCIQIIILMLLVASAAHASQPKPGPDSRPVVGLVLSGGGARGAVHLGVLKVIEELRVPIDIITGTSVGGIVGGLYALGYSSAEMDELLAGLDWNEIFIDKPPRAQLNLRRKEVNFNFLARVEAGVNSSGIMVPSGLVFGQKMNLMLKALTLFAPEQFDDFPIKYRTVAVDVETGEAVVLSRGDAATAMRASMSIPGIFAPVAWDGRLLVDGGFVNNVPVKLARELGAEVLIVVDLSTKPKPKEELTSPLGIMNQMLGFQILQHSNEQLKLLGPGDILIQPDTTAFASTDFVEAENMVNLGVDAGRDAANSLKRLSLPEPAYQQYLAGKQKPAVAPRVVRDVVIQNDSRLNPRILKAQLDTRAGMPLSIPKLNSDMAKIYGLDIFQSVDYAITDTDAGTQLEITAREKEWGPNYIGFGLVSEDPGNVQVASSYTVTPINSGGGEWHSEIQLGYNKSISSEFYQPLDQHLRYFVQTWAAYRETHFGRYEDGRKAAEYISAVNQLGIGAGRWLGECCKLHFDVISGSRNTEPVVGDLNVEHKAYATGSWSAGIDYDRLDSINFPKSGSLANLTWTMEKKSLGADIDQSKLQVNLLKAGNWRENTVLLWAGLGGVARTEAPAASGFSVGGFFNLSGYEKAELSGRYAAMLRMIYFRELGRIPGALNIPFYAGVSLEAGNVWDNRDDIRADTLMTAGSILLAMDTPLGPLYVARGFAEGGRSKSYIFLGRSFTFF